MLTVLFASHFHYIYVHTKKSLLLLTGHVTSKHLLHVDHHITFKN
jgi:hypothetical protein